MDIFFYTSSAEPNSFPKVLGSAIRYQGELRDECDILNPVLTIEGLSPDTTFNYCYIPDFKRYYFITESSVVRTGLMEFMLHVDVLQSWSSQILEQTGYVSRNEYYYDLMLIDEFPVLLPNSDSDILYAECDTKYNSIKITNDKYQYILTLAASPTTRLVK